MKPAAIRGFERTAAVLQTKSLSAGFEQTVVVKKIDLVLKSGQIVAIAGPNGAGKSTLLKTLARHLPAIEGKVELDGKNVWLLPASDFAGKVAYVPQELDPRQDLTVEELVMLGRNPHQKWWQWQGSPADKAAVDEALDATEIKSLRSKSLGHLSGGERQRAAIAVALAQQPAFMLLDEPTSHLDFRHQIELVQLLKNLRQASLGILVVLHDLNLIARVADQVLMLKADSQTAVSEAAASGAPEQVFQPETLAKIFGVDVSIVSDPHTNELIYHPFRASQNR